MTDRDVQREIEENQRRVRDKEDVGLDENVLRQRDDDTGTFLEDALDSIPGIGDDDSEEHDVEYDDNTKHTTTPN